MLIGNIYCIYYLIFLLDLHLNKGKVSCNKAVKKKFNARVSNVCPLTFQAAKDVVLAEKPVISDDSNSIDPSLLDELLANIATLSSVYHKPPDAFVTRVKTIQKTEEEEYPDASEGGYSESPAHATATGASPPPAATRPPAATPAPVPDLLDLMGMDNSSAIVPTDPASPAVYVYYILVELC